MRRPNDTAPVFATLLAWTAAACAAAPAEPRATVMDATRPAFTLADTDGRTYDFARETADRITLLAFGFTHCPDVCPLHMAAIADVVEDLTAEERGRVRVVFVTVDPERDTPEALRTWLDHFDTSFVGLRGDIAEVDAILGDLRLPAVSRGHDHATGQTIGHTVRVLAYPASGDYTLLFSPDTLAEDLRHDLPILLAEAR